MSFEQIFGISVKEFGRNLLCTIVGFAALFVIFYFMTTLVRVLYAAYHIHSDAVARDTHNKKLLDALSELGAHSPSDKLGGDLQIVLPKLSGQRYILTKERCGHLANCKSLDDTIENEDKTHDTLQHFAVLTTSKEDLSAERLCDGLEAAYGLRASTIRKNLTETMKDAYTTDITHVDGGTNKACKEIYKAILPDDCGHDFAVIIRDVVFFDTNKSALVIFGYEKRIGIGSIFTGADAKRANSAMHSAEIVLGVMGQAAH